MREMMLRRPAVRKQKVELNPEERTQLTTIIDLLIPSDKDFPPPSTLYLIDDFLRYFSPSRVNQTLLMLSEKRLRMLLYDLNILADGNFCGATREKQQAVLKHFERGDPALFQAFWTLINHSYYTRLATLRRPLAVV